MSETDDERPKHDPINKDLGGWRLRSRPGPKYCISCNGKNLTYFRHELGITHEAFIRCNDCGAEYTKG